MSLLIFASMSPNQSSADSHQGVLYSEITNIVQDGVELVHPDRKTVYLKVELEIWSTYEETVTLQFAEFLPGGNYRCGMQFISSLNSSYGFNFVPQENMYRNCISSGSISANPGISMRDQWISAVAFTSDRNFANQFSILELAYTQFANISDILFDQLYNATLIGPDFALNADILPLGWGGTRNPNNQDQIQMRISSTSLMRESFEQSKTTFSFGIESQVVNTYNTVQTVVAPCTHWIDVYIKANTTSGYFTASSPGVCFTALSGQNIEPGITPLSLVLDLQLNGTHTFLPDGIYDFIVDAKMTSYGMTWVIVDGFIEVLKDVIPVYEFGLTESSDKSLAESTVEIPSTASLSNNLPLSWFAILPFTLVIVTRVKNQQNKFHC